MPTDRKLTAGGLDVSVPGLGWNMANTIEKGLFPEIHSINDAALFMKHIRQYHSSDSVIIVDEFDKLIEDEDRAHFADLIIQISDRDIEVKKQKGLA